MRYLFFLLPAIFICNMHLFGQTSIGRDRLLFEKANLLQDVVYEQLNNRDYYDDEDEDTPHKEVSLTDSIEAEYAAVLRDNLLEKALGYYQELTDSFPHSSLYVSALSNKAGIAYELGDTAAAMASYTAVLSSTAIDTERNGNAKGLMADPYYTNYKNTAAKMLGKIAIAEQRYADALNYLDLTEKYPYHHFCGNAYAADHAHITEQYARCYLGMGNEQKAYTLLLPFILDNPMGSNPSLTKMAYDLLLKKHSRQELLQAYDKAFQHVKKVKRTGKYGAYTEYFIRFLGNDVKLDYLLLDADLTKSDFDKFMSHMRTKNYFYKLLKAESLEGAIDSKGHQ